MKPTALDRLLDIEKAIEHAGIPWRQIIGTRNFLAHGYNVIRPERIWNIVVADLPELKRDVLQLIKSLEK